MVYWNFFKNKLKMTREKIKVSDLIGMKVTMKL